MELVRIADAVRGDTNKHMAHEEQEVLPLLEAHLCAAEQRAMVWRTLRAMPLRLLERVMPWVAGTAVTQLTIHYQGTSLCRIRPALTMLKCHALGCTYSPQVVSVVLIETDSKN